MSRMRVLCDFGRVPISYDFVIWLVRAKLEAQRAGHTGIHVLLNPREEPDADGYGGHRKIGRDWGGHDNAVEAFRFWHIVVPALQVAGATFEFRLEPIGQFVELDALAHHAGGLIAAGRNGESIPRINASPLARASAKKHLARLGKRVATITIRAHNATDGRDSDGSQWALVQQWLEVRGWGVVVVSDTAKALRQMTPAYAIDLDLRLALYQEAALNLHVTGGPAHICWFCEAPFIQFKCARPHEPYRKHWEKYLMLKTGDQLPWASPKQVLNYGEDDAANVFQAIEAWEKRCVG